MKELKVFFYIKRDKVNKKGLSAIYGKISYCDSTITYSTGISMNSTDWEKTKQLSKPKSDEEKKLQRELNRQDERIQQIRDLLKLQALPITANIIKLILLEKESVTKKEPEKITLKKVMSELIKEKEELVRLGRRRKASLTKYNSTRRHFFHFLEQTRGLHDINLIDMEYKLITDFYLYLIGDKIVEEKKNKGICNNTSQKYIQNFRSSINHAIKLDYIQKDPFKAYEYEWDEVDTTFLTKVELTAIESKIFTNKRLDVIKDIFLFSCYTGYAPIDLIYITKDCIELRDDGAYWFNMSRHKTGIKSDVMVFHQTQAIMDKYKNDPLCISKNMVIPYRANQTMNEYLKELAYHCGIKKNLKHYVARHTFATTIMLGNGASIEVTGKALGHKRISQTQHYAKITNQHSSEEMKRVNKKMNPSIEKEEQNKIFNLEEVSENVYANEMKFVQQKMREEIVE